MLEIQPDSHPGLIRRLFTRTNFYTLAIVLLLFAALPLSQQLGSLPDDSQVMVREVGLAPPPPPPPESRQQNQRATGGSLGGIDLSSVPTAVQLLPLSMTSAIGDGNGLNLGLGDFDLGTNIATTFSMEGVGFGTEGLDRPPIMIVRPTLQDEYMRENNITSFDVDLMVKLRADGRITLISIEHIDIPDPELEKLVRQAIPRIRYSKPTVNGVPVERFGRLTLTINAN